MHLLRDAHITSHLQMPQSLFSVEARSPKKKANKPTPALPLFSNSHSQKHLVIGFQFASFKGQFGRIMSGRRSDHVEKTGRIMSGTPNRTDNFLLPTICVGFLLLLKVPGRPGLSGSPCFQARNLFFPDRR